MLINTFLLASLAAAAVGAPNYGYDSYSSSYSSKSFPTCKHHLSIACCSQIIVLGRLEDVSNLSREGGTDAFPLRIARHLRGASDATDAQLSS
ncbi:hypothetical protein BDK51DRAFT_49748 [Blyttiomyces helicus]|uniref:Hydrophobin n=1 Tax=Blyttiomyces helicus TaxID=388810 RepID=A0A4P9W6Y4_9FUNG|nr:hypothetical protein BDK51DRAFT_49748 [Blyttiomyces helicus]|eukprot:RKO88094.1 hypothetical protein BDK51DRAFT_49748 [Blyttiomyces helicus]